MTELTDALEALKVRRAEFETRSIIGATVSKILGRSEPTSIADLDDDIRAIEARIAAEQTAPADAARLATRQVELVEIARKDLAELRDLTARLDAVIARTSKTATEIEATSATVNATLGGNFVGLTGPFRGKGPVLGALRAVKLRESLKVWAGIAKGTTL